MSHVRLPGGVTSQPDESSPKIFSKWTMMQMAEKQSTYEPVDALVPGQLGVPPFARWLLRVPSAFRSLLTEPFHMVGRLRIPWDEVEYRSCLCRNHCVLEGIR